MKRVFFWTVRIRVFAFSRWQSFPRGASQSERDVLRIPKVMGYKA
jgi:hypothetical protein